MSNFQANAYGQALFRGLEFGQAGSRPYLGEYVHECNAQPSNAVLRAGPVRLAPQYPDWQVTYYDDASMQTGVVTYQYVERLDGQDAFWAYPEGIPCGTSIKEAPGGTGMRAMVMQMQTALRDRGYDPGTIDGKPGPNTCGAAYLFQYEQLGYDDNALGPEFFVALGMPESSYLQLGLICGHWWEPFDEREGAIPAPEPFDPVLPGEIEEPDEPPVVVIPEPGPTPFVPPVTPPVLPPIEPEPTPALAGMPWWMALAMLGTVVGTGLVARKKKGKKKGGSMGRWWR
jgi:peptidoglycan hydrolase-like protein with peptidoglycan-binding domain